MLMRKGDKNLEKDGRKKEGGKARIGQDSIKNFKNSDMRRKRRETCKK